MDVIREAFKEFGIQLQHAGKTKTGENIYKGMCPFEHQGTDRFTVWELGNYLCNQCGARGWLQHAPKFDPSKAKEFLDHLKQEEERVAQQRLEQLERWKLEDHTADIMRWHRNNKMDYWVREGVPEWAISKFYFGYCDAKRIKDNGNFIEVPAYTMPIYTPSGSLVNIQYRLVGHEKGKYRQEPNIPAATWFATDDRQGVAIAVEGLKKAVIVTDFTEWSCQVIGFPSNMPSQETIDAELRKFKRIYLIFDPGSDSQIKRMGRMLPGRISVVTLPCKPDDAIVKHKISKTQFRSFFADNLVEKL